MDVIHYSNKDKRSILITATFIWEFKKGDNIVYNFDILEELYRGRSLSKNPDLFIKPIVITIASIVECILDDFVNRIQQRVSDPLPNITPAVIADFKYKKKGQTLEIKKLEKFNHYIDIARKHNIFNRPGAFYKILDLLREVRNRVHIQNKSNSLEKDEVNVYTKKTLEFAERVLEIIIIEMMVKYPRSVPEISPAEFPFPWTAHYKPKVA